MSHHQHSIPVDPTLNHLETAMDTDKMQGFFQRLLYSDGSNDIVDCEIERIKYKPQKNCHVSYRIKVRNRHSNRSMDKLLCARFYEKGGSNSRFFKELDKAEKQDLLLHIPELDCLTWIYPNDRKLIHLQQLTDADFLHQHCAEELIAHHLGSQWQIFQFQATVIRYVPEQNCTVRATINIQNRLSRKTRQLIVYGKTCYNDDGQQVFSHLYQLWHSQARRQARLNIPEPLLYQPQYKMLWQMGVPGTVLMAQCTQTERMLKSVADMARQIACLHQTALYDCRRMEKQALLKDLDKVRQQLFKCKVPGHHRIIHNINGLVLFVRHKMKDKQCLIHGDLHLKNILADADKVYLIDLDNLTVGHPLLDVGSFISALINMKFVGSLPEQLAEQSIETFLQTYVQSVPWQIEQHQLHCFVAYTLIVERVFRGFSRLKAGRLEIIEKLAVLAESLLNGTNIPPWLLLQSKL